MYTNNKELRTKRIPKIIQTTTIVFLKIETGNVRSLKGVTAGGEPDKRSKPESLGTSF
jgi:hypothetical protein